MTNNGAGHTEEPETSVSADPLRPSPLNQAAQNDSTLDQRSEKLSVALATVAAMKLDSEPILIEEVRRPVKNADGGFSDVQLYALLVIAALDHGVRFVYGFELLVNARPVVLCHLQRLWSRFKTVTVSFS